MEKKLRELNITPEIKGYECIIEAYKFMTNYNNINNLIICNELYPYVAKKLNTSPACVERAIRHAIERSYKKGYLNKLYRERPSNKLFLIDLFLGNL